MTDREKAITVLKSELYGIPSDLVSRLNGFKYVTTEVFLREHEVAHFDIYKRGWNDAIQAVIDASDMPVTDIIKAIKENEVKQNEVN